MALKTLVAVDQIVAAAPNQRAALIATTAAAIATSSAVAASATVATASIARTSGMVGWRMVTAEPAKMAASVATDAAAAIRCGKAVARRAATNPAILRARHQQVTNQRAADRNSKGRHYAHHRFPDRRNRPDCV
jgi:hypothetical protein